MIPEVARLSRRSVVAVAAVGAVSGCSGGDGGAGGPGGSVPAPGAAQTAQAVRDSTALLAAYDAALAAHPALAGRLAPLRAEVARHLGVFGGNPPAAPQAPATGAPAAPATASATDAATDSASDAATAAASATASASAPGTAPPSTPASGGTPATALASLAALERTVADRRAAALLYVPGEQARLLASVAAAGAGHVVLLGAGARNG